jgi:predicted transcriptional regulator
MTVGFTVRLEKEAVEAIDALAKRTDRSRNWIVNQAVRDYVELQSWQEARIDEGLRAMERGEFASEDEVREALSRHGKE